MANIINIQVYTEISEIMYYDLCLPSTNYIDLTHILNSLSPHLYRAAAINHQFVDATITPPPENYNKLKENHKHITLYSRATLTIQHSATLHQLNQFSNNGYEITAVRPKNQKMFHSLCVEYDNYDIISIDMSIKLPYMLKRNPVYEALRKGKYFQLQYSSMFDDNTRVVCMTNMINLIKATGGKQLIFSSNAESTQTHRTPYDAAALLASLGLPKNQALATMKENAENVIKNSIHRKFFKGTIQQISIPMVEKLSKRIKKHRQRVKQLMKKE